MSRFLRSLPAQLLLVTILPFTFVLAGIAFGSVTMHQQAMRQMVSERDMRTVMATSLMLTHLLAESPDGRLKLQPEQFNALVNPMPNTKPVTAFLFDKVGRALYHTDPTKVGSDLSAHGGVQKVLRGQFGVLYLRDTPSSPEHVISYGPVVVGSARYGLVLEEPWEEVIDPLMQYSLMAPLVLLPVTLIAAIAVVAGMRRIVQPLQQLTKQATHASAGDLAALQQPVAGIDEITQLQTTLQTMTQQIEADKSRLRTYANAVTSAQEQERSRLARELHDDTIQNLIVLAQRIQMARMSAKPDDAAMRGRLDDMHAGVLAMIDDVRRISRALRPIYLEEAGLASGLERLAQEANALTQKQERSCRVTFEASGSIPRLHPDMEMTFFRIAQEGINNALKHADPSEIKVRLSSTSDAIELSIHDDGCGFDPAHVVPGFGLTGIHERAMLIHATMTMTSAPSQGTSLVVRLPVKHLAPQNLRHPI
jgi:two-component system sensor histidine kinase UhpB